MKIDLLKEALKREKFAVAFDKIGKSWRLDCHYVIETAKQIDVMNIGYMTDESLPILLERLATIISALTN